MDIADRLNPRGELLRYGLHVSFRRMTALPYGDGQAELLGLENGKRQNVLWIIRRRPRFCHAFTQLGTSFSLLGNVLAGFALSSTIDAHRFAQAGTRGPSAPGTGDTNRWAGYEHQRLQERSSLRENGFSSWDGLLSPSRTGLLQHRHSAVPCRRPLVSSRTRYYLIRST